MLCTQCEPEGFRRITWFPDRPDNLAQFITRIETTKNFEYLLSNGNLIKSNFIKNNKIHYAIWNDPFPKPSYLFALVVGNLDLAEDNYTTKTKKNIATDIY